MQMKLYRGHKRFFGDKYLSESGLKRAQQFSSRYPPWNLRSTQLCHPVLERHTFNLRLRHSIFVVFMLEAGHDSTHREFVSTIVTYRH